MKICKDGAVLVKAYAMSLYPSIPHETGLKTLRKRLNEPAASKIPTEDILQMLEYVLKNLNFFLNLMERLNNKNQEQQLVPNLNLALLAFLWMK